MRRSPSQGFTLIEVLVVIAIIAVLASILLPNLLGAQKKPYDVAALECGKAVVIAETAFHAGNGTYTNSLPALGSDVQEQCADSGVQINTHASTVSATTSGNNDLGASTDNFAFIVYHPKGSGFYRYWKASPTLDNDRLNRRFDFTP